MAIRSLSTASISTGSKRSKFWDQSTVLLASGSYESIATYGSGSSTITFSSIPSTYKHLQLRFYWNAGSSSADLALKVNSTVPTNAHIVYGTGTNPTISAASDYDATHGWWQIIGNFNSSYNNYPTPGVVDFIDYADTNKSKVAKLLVGSEYNSGDTKNRVGLKSAFWSTTSAISSITLYQTGGSMSSGTSFALYGIKG